MNYQHLRGVIIEGMSCGGKTSLFNALKTFHANNYERSIIALGEHYSQVLHNKNGSHLYSSRDEHIQLLQSKVDFLLELGDWGNSLGPASIQSRGLFFIFERFHLNHHHAFPESNISEIEQSLLKCNAKSVLLTISPETVIHRLKSRYQKSSLEELERSSEDFIREQQRFIDLSRKSPIPTIIINTDKMEWNKYAEMVFGFVDK